MAEAVSALIVSLSACSGTTVCSDQSVCLSADAGFAAGVHDEYDWYLVKDGSYYALGTTYNDYSNNGKQIEFNVTNQYYGSGAYKIYTSAWFYNYPQGYYWNEDGVSNSIQVKFLGSPTAASKINGITSSTLDVCPTQQIRLDGSGSSCASGYFVSVMKSNPNWGSAGPEYMRWLSQADFNSYGSISNFDVRGFLASYGQSFAPDSYYRVKLAVGSVWSETTKLIHIKSAASCPAETGIRLKHEASNGCLYSTYKNGEPVYHWDCWSDPNMLFEFDYTANNQFRIRHKLSGQCLYGNPVNGGEAHHYSCWNDPNMTFSRQDLGNGKFRLVHLATGKCLYNSGPNGAKVYNWDCWNDPNMIYSAQ